MISVVGVDHINIRVADLERSLRFYQGVLGMREVTRNIRQDGSVGLLALRAGTAVIFLQPSPGYRPPADDKDSGLDHFSLEIEKTDAEGLATWLREQGVPIVTGPVRRNGSHGNGTSIYVRDPDGHEVEIKQHNLG